LARRTLGQGALFVFAVGASSPLTVLIGGIVSMYSLTGVTGVPLSFLVMMVLLGMLVVGYVAMSRHVIHSAPFYAQLSQGLSPQMGVAGGAVALLGYNAIQISLYGLVGTTLADLAGGSWWGWTGGAWLVVAVLGQFGGATNAKVLGSLLAVEIAVIALFDIAAFSNPAEHTISLTPLMPSSLLAAGASGVLAFSMASFTGAESPSAFGEEARSPQTLIRATLIGITFLGVFYAATAWAYATASGPGEVIKPLGSAASPFDTLGRVFGQETVTLATLLLVTSALAAMSAFHATVARYIFALARERVLPSAWAKVSSGSAGGAPLGGSLVQSVVAAVTIGAFLAAGADPMGTMFVWLSTVGAFSVLVLLTVSAMAARAFFASGRGAHESIWVRQVIPSAGSVIGVLVLLFMSSNLASLLGTPPGSLLKWLVPAGVAGVLGIGWLWGLWLRQARPQIYAQLGKGTPNPLTVQDQRLSDLAV
jgi:amino acid transporter